MHSHQRIGITSSRTTDTGVFFREDGKEWLGERKMHRGFQALCKTMKRISSVFSIHHTLFSSAFFFYLLFLFL
jgi:hypothetical protein